MMDSESRGYWWAFDSFMEEMESVKSGDFRKLDMMVTSFFGAVSVTKAFTSDLYTFDKGALRGLGQAYKLTRDRWILGHLLKYHLKGSN